MSIIDQFGAVIAVFILLGGSLWFLKRKGYVNLATPFLGKTDSRRRIQLVERCALTPQHSIHIVRVANRTLLIGVAPNNCMLLSDQIEETQP